MRLEELSEHGSPEGNRSGERKRPRFHSPRSRTICVQTGTYWHCFEGNLGESAEIRAERVWDFPSAMMPS